MVACAAPRMSKSKLACGERRSSIIVHLCLSSQSTTTTYTPAPVHCLPPHLLLIHTHQDYDTTSLRLSMGWFWADQTSSSQPVAVAPHPIPRSDATPPVNTHAIPTSKHKMLTPASQDVQCTNPPLPHYLPSPQNRPAHAPTSHPLAKPPHGLPPNLLVPRSPN